MFRSGLNKDIREALMQKNYSSLEEIIETLLLAENPID